MTRIHWLPIFAGLTLLVASALAYDAWIAQASTTRATLTGRHAKCGPTTNSGPKEMTSYRHPKRYRLMARLDDGQLIRVERKAADFPSCGATLTIAERITPWGSVWYWTDQ
jgi:hypothetical protein